jgi:hypothetical protein
MVQKNDAALRKRAQINKANRTMFLWIAIASALVGAAIVVSIFMFQKLMYNEKVLAEKQKTVTVLAHNNEAIKGLQDEIRAIDADSALSSVKANDDDQAIQVILDALPADANSLALGASLQNKLLNVIPGLTIESLRVDPVVGVEVLSDDSAPVEASTSDTTSNVITFQFSVKGSNDAMRKVLENLEKSIRTIKVNTLRVEIQPGGSLSMSVSAQAYYEPATTLKLEDKVVPR